MELSIYTYQGTETGEKITLADDVFNIEPSDHAIYQDVRLITAHQRQGTHKTKERGEVRGSTKKPFKQKGTGNARQGHKRSPLHRHGGTIFGPRPHEYDFKLNKKVKRLARKSALSYKLRNQRITVLDALSFEKPRTQDFASMVTALQQAERKVLFVLPAVDKADAQLHQQHIHNVYLSGRNLPKVQITSVLDLNTYDILHADALVLLKAAVPTLHTLLSDSQL